MALNTTLASSSLKIFNPDALYVTLFETNSQGVLAKAGDTYKLSEVIRDTTSITQDDPTENKIENEFGSAPILSNTQLGSYQFSAEVADMQSTLLEKLCGYVKGTGTAQDRVFAPSTYTPIYAEIALAFKTGDNKYVAAVLPKVQLNSKATFDSLSSNMGRITLAGTGQNIAVPTGDNTTMDTPFYLDTNFTTNELIVS
jgi:hypothetical protein